jgi:tetratricopeptide (TPR) repeat protein
MVKIALALLNGEVARGEGNLASAIVGFEQARTLELALPYTEPPYWHQPTAHILGAALLQAHRPAEAEHVYRDSLTTYRLDGWALFGLAQALEAQGKPAAAKEVRTQFDKVWNLADVRLAGSRF